jgi:thiol-disulfide isomerase/thioredoxin
MRRFDHRAVWLVLALGVGVLALVGACGAGEGTGNPPAKAESATTTTAAPKVHVDTYTLKPAPDFQVTDLEGKTRSLSEFKGKVLILDFWATWCGPCRLEIPHFIDLYKEYKEQGLEVVGLSLDAGGKKDVEPFAKAKGINYHMLIGNQTVANSYGGVRGIPTAFVLTQDGKIYRKYVGYRERAVFESDIRALLGLGPIAEAEKEG